MSSDVVITVEHLSKKYRLGQIGVDSLREAVEAWWHRLRGRDPAEHMGEVGRGESIQKSEVRGQKGEEGKRGESVQCSEVSGQLGREGIEPQIDECRISNDEGVEKSEDGRQKRTTNNQQRPTNNPPPTTDTTRPGELWALRDVSFEVKRGEVLGIIGRNGAGKSTLLKILTRITEPTSGRAVMRGRVASLLEVGTGFHPELTGRENIFLNGAILGMKRREIAAKFDEIVAFAEVEKFIDTPVKRYSSGMYVRLAFAVAAHLEPEILLVDEVLAVGDAGFQQKCIGKMSLAANEGKTVLLVSHNTRVIQTLCRKCLLLEKGSTVALGCPADIVTKYNSALGDGEVWAAVPRDYLVTVSNPLADIENIELLGGEDGNVGSTICGGRLTIKFDVVTCQPISDGSVCVFFCRDGVVVSGNNSHHVGLPLKMEAGQRVHVEIIYSVLNLVPSPYSVLVFIRPSYLASLRDSATNIQVVRLLVTGKGSVGGGYAYLPQVWRMSTCGNLASE